MKTIQGIIDIPKPKYKYQQNISKAFDIRAFLRPGTELLSGGGVDTLKVYYDVLGRTIPVIYQVAKDLNQPIEVILN